MGKQIERMLSVERVEDLIAVFGLAVPHTYGWDPLKAYTQVALCLSE